jgi:hypothetical protein
MSLEQLLRDAGVELDRQASAQELMASGESSRRSDAVSLTRRMVDRRRSSGLVRAAAVFILLIGGGATLWLLTDHRSNQSSSDQPRVSSPLSSLVTAETNTTAQLVISGEANAFLEFFWPVDEEARIQSARDRKINECMRALGFDYYPPQAEDPPVSSSTLHGYGVVDEMTSSQAGDSPTAPVDEYLVTLTPEERDRFLKALNGQPPSSGSCTQKATRQAHAELQLEFPRFDPLYSNILDDYGAALNTDQQLLDAAIQWVDCVEERTQLLSVTGSTLELTRDNIRLAATADIAGRLGRSVRPIAWGELAEVDTTKLAPPIDHVFDESPKFGFLIWGPPTRLDPATIEGAIERELAVRAADEECWIEVGGEARLRELQDRAMAQVALLSAPES